VLDFATLLTILSGPVLVPSPKQHIMMRNNPDDDWSAIDGEPIDGTASVGTATTATESFVNVSGGNNQEETLSLQVTPSNDSVGFFATQTKSKVTVSLKACEITEYSNNGSRAPVDVVVALDRSGSMCGEKIKACKRTLELMVRHLGSSDRLGLVSFESETKLEFSPTFMTNENKEETSRKIKTIRAGGGTNLSGGLATAALELARIDMPNSVRSIFLLTDGHPNGGVSDTSVLVEMVRSLNKTEDDSSSGEAGRMLLHDAVSDSNIRGGEFYSREMNPVIVNKPISLFCFGYGSDHNSQMLKAISDATPGGAYYFVEKDSNVSTAFGDAMGGLLSVVAQGVTVSISVPPEAEAKGVKILKVYHKQAVKRSDTCYTVNVGDFYAEEERDVLLEMELASAAPSDPAPAVHADVAVSFMDTIHKRPASLGPVNCLIGRPANFEVSAPNDHVEVQWLRIQTARAIEAANEKAANSGDMDEARQILQNAENSITQSQAYKNDSPPIMLEGLLTDLRELTSGFRSYACYHASGSHSAATVSLGYERQRCVESSASKSNQFRTSTKTTMSLGFMS
jgi:Mg-chelatase subunit ChlD